VESYIKRNIILYSKERRSRRKISYCRRKIKDIVWRRTKQMKKKKRRKPPHQRHHVFSILKIKTCDDANI